MDMCIRGRITNLLYIYIKLYREFIIMCSQKVGKLFYQGLTQLALLQSVRLDEEG